MTKLAYICKECGKSLKTLQSRKKHSCEAGVFWCAACNQKFSDKDEWKQHTAQCTTAFKWNCEECGLELRSMRAVKRHKCKPKDKNNFSKLKKYREEQNKIAAKIAEKKKNKTEFKCEACNVYEETLEDLLEHQCLDSHFYCVTCGSKYNTQNGINEHVCTGASAFSCPACFKTFKNEIQLKSHESKCEEKKIEKLAKNPKAFLLFKTYIKNNSKAFNRLEKKGQYRAFVKNQFYKSLCDLVEYGNLIGTKRLNDYCAWLIRNKIHINDWCSDISFYKFIRITTLDQNMFDSVMRSMKNWCDEMYKFSKRTNQPLSDAIENTRIIEASIKNGNISPAMLFSCSIFKPSMGLWLSEDIDYLAKLIDVNFEGQFPHVFWERYLFKHTDYKNLVSEADKYLAEFLEEFS